jgi:phytanoyl-CoA hydroxylase
MNANIEYPAGLYGGTIATGSSVDLDRIGDGDIDFFHREGYLVVERAFDSGQIEAARQAVDDLIDGKNPDFRGLQLEPGIGAERAGDLEAAAKRRVVRKLMGFVDYDPRLKAMAADAPIGDLVERLMGDRPVLFQDMALLKGPGGREKPWHQDCAYFNLPLGTVVVGVWIALDEATVENGCLHILPGTHREGPAEHFKVRDWQICDTRVQTQRDIAVPLPAGGCLLWHGMLHHGSPDNTTDTTRRALQFHYKPGGSGQTTTDERMQHFGGEVRGAEC